MERELVKKRRLYSFLAKLRTNPGQYVNLYLKPSSFPDRISELLIETGHDICVGEIKDSVANEAVVTEAERYRTGAVIFWGKHGEKYVVLPPFPISDDRISVGELDASFLHETLERRYVTGVVLVTWGSYSLGIFDHDNLVDSKTGTGYIHKQHRKGGMSEKRFARRTEEQKRNFLRKVSNRIEERFKNYTLDYIFFGGNRLIVKPLLKECRYLELEAHKISGRILNIRYADREDLNHSMEEITKSLVFSF
jgi:peptide subunit release factor 1 (eRF1)